MRALGKIALWIVARRISFMAQSPLSKLLPTYRSFSIQELLDGSYLNKQPKEFFFDHSTYHDLAKNFKLSIEEIYTKSQIEVQELDESQEVQESDTNAYALNQSVAVSLPEDIDEIAAPSELKEPPIAGYKSFKYQDYDDDDESTFEPGLYAGSVLPEDMRPEEEDEDKVQTYVIEFEPVSSLLQIIDEYLSIPGNKLKFKGMDD